jgi:uncharacterized protein (TIGR02246 family)
MNKTLDSELVKAATHSCQVYDDAYNNNDPHALAKLFTEDATLVTDTGIPSGRDAILIYQTEAFKIVKFSNHKGKADLDSIILNTPTGVPIPQTQLHLSASDAGHQRWKLDPAIYSYQQIEYACYAILALAGIGALLYSASVFLR